ncbi:unnamed protein product, partial [Ascophyllum nodosum]
QAIKEKVHRVLPRNALHSLTARRHQRSTTRLPCLHRGPPCLHQGSSSHPPPVIPPLACVLRIPCTPPLFCLLRTAMSTAKILLYTKTLISTLKTHAFRTKTPIATPKTTISTPEP